MPVLLNCIAAVPALSHAVHWRSLLSCTGSAKRRWRAEAYEAASNGLIVLFLYAGATPLLSAVLSIGPPSPGPLDGRNTALQLERTPHSLMWVRAALYLATGSTFLPPDGSAWAVCLVWAVSGTCGYIVDKVRPSLSWQGRGVRPTMY